MNRRMAAIVAVIVGLVLFLDEIWMFIPGLGWPGWLIGDWTWMHVEPFHHWMLGVVLVISGGVMLR